MRLAKRGDARQRFDQRGGRVLDGDVATREHKCAYFGGGKRQAFQLPVANSLIACQDNPVVTPGMRKPGFVCGAPGEVFCQALDGNASVVQRLDYGEAVERLVYKEDEGFRQP